MALKAYMNRRLFLILAFAFVFIGLLIFYFKSTEYIEYKPVYINSSSDSVNNLYEIKNIDLSESELQKIAFVLDAYNMDYKWNKEKNILLVHRRYIKNKEIMSNVTLKANDEMWLKLKNYNQ